MAGAVDLDPVGGVSLMSPAGTQQLPLSAADPNSPSGGGGFIAVFDATTTKVENFTLMVLLRNGSSLSYTAPSAINLRAQDGTRRLSIGIEGAYVVYRVEVRVLPENPNHGLGWENGVAFAGTGVNLQRTG